MTNQSLDTLVSETIEKLKKKPERINPYSLFESHINGAVSNLKKFRKKNKKKTLKIVLDILKGALNDYRPGTPDTIWRKEVVQQIYEDCVWEFYRLNSEGTIETVRRFMDDDRLDLATTYDLIKRKGYIPIAVLTYALGQQTALKAQEAYRAKNPLQKINPL